MNDSECRVTKIALFYDGNFFFNISNYYRYAHERGQRLSVPGLHDFVRHAIAQEEGVDKRFCRIVEAHFFRGRLSAKEAEARQKLYVERVFEDVLMREGVVTHYLPVRNRSEKGIDVWLALETYELAVHKNFDVVVFIAGDSDFVALARKIHSLGTRTMVLGWDFSYTDDFGRERETVTSARLLDEVTYPLRMHEIIDDGNRRGDAVVEGLFVEDRRDEDEESNSDEGFIVEEPAATYEEGDTAFSRSIASGQRMEGEVLSLKAGYGFIRASGYPNNVFFHWEDLTNCEFDELTIGDSVSFTPTIGERGPIAKEVERMD